MNHRGPVRPSDSRRLYCLGCGYEVTHAPASTCPECGRPFDRTDRRTHGRCPRTGSRLRTLNLVFTIVLAVLAVSFLAETVILFIGWDPLVAFLLSLGTVPLMLVLVVMVLIPSLEADPSTRVLAVLLPVAVVFTTWPVVPGAAGPFVNWPFRVSFLMHRSALEDMAAEHRDRGRTPPSTGVGVLRFIDARFIDPGNPGGSNLGFQITGGAWGGVHLVQTGTDATFVWWNTNWEIDLGDGWHLVQQD